LADVWNVIALLKKQTIARVDQDGASTFTMPRCIHGLHGCCLNFEAASCFAAIVLCAHVGKRHVDMCIDVTTNIRSRNRNAGGIVTSHFVEWQGAPIKSVKTGFRHAVDLAGLWGKVTPHTLRHTAATWLMQRGVPIWQAAGYLGMSAAMIERTYGHHHPDYMRGAAAAITTKQSQNVSGQSANVLLVNPLVGPENRSAGRRKT